ncbi:MAG: hypothetical protein ACFE9R_08945, partial [Candidatus Hermodarchaeota archaeon]
MDILFDAKDLIESFYKEMWITRLNLAKSCQNPISDREKLLAAQRIIDRIIFLYFLGSKKFIRMLDSSGKEHPLNIKGLMEGLSRTPNCQILLNQIFFDHLNNQTDRFFTAPKILQNYQLYIPFLNGGLFSEHHLTEISGSKTYSERQLSFNFNWFNLISVLNRYNWLIDDSLIEEGETGNLTPETLGYLYEKFVITIGALSKVSLSDFTEDPEDLRIGNKKIGAFYTRDQITHYICANAIWNHLRQLHSELAPFNQYKDFFNPETFPTIQPKLKSQILESLIKITICDPAVGSGAF